MSQQNKSADDIASSPPSDDVTAVAADQSSGNSDIAPPGRGNLELELANDEYEEAHPQLGVSEIISNTTAEEPRIGKSSSSRNTRELSDMVVKAAESSRKSKRATSSLAQLRLANMKLHGREEDMKLLRRKLLEQKNKTNEKNNATHYLPGLILISGISGTGKSALVMKGVKDPAEKMGMTFVGGKFDLNSTSIPLSAFVDAMKSLTNVVIEGDMRKKTRIQDDITGTFGEGDLILLVRALPGCERLFSLHNEDKGDGDGDKEAMARQQYETLSVVGKEAVSRLQYTIRRLLKIICAHLDGVVLFIDDLQVRLHLTANTNMDYALCISVFTHPIFPFLVHKNSGVILER